mmetsp:Transcript_14779/g.25914  ORF Transcript_14779/g.25914 Transcript_14779/m.25914 type:complete len:106 (+) Transcript_14779:1245-1562(+)
MYSYTLYFLLSNKIPISITGISFDDFARTCVGKDTYFKDSNWHQLLSTFENETKAYKWNGQQLSYCLGHSAFLGTATTKPETNVATIRLQNTKKVELFTSLDRIS